MYVRERICFLADRNARGPMVYGEEYTVGVIGRVVKPDKSIKPHFLRPNGGDATTCKSLTRNSFQG